MGLSSPDAKVQQGKASISFVLHTHSSEKAWLLGKNAKGNGWMTMDEQMCAPGWARSV
jgi:hypothetical protein